jgi:AcrR family transcriptional regulator
MRVTAEAKESTRRAILDAAQTLFRTAGFEATTTRDVVKAAGIATGTLFNYFSTKEAIVIALVVESQALKPLRTADARPASLEEALFSLVAAELRQLKPHRTYLMPILESTLSPLAEARGDDSGQALRSDHLARVVELARQYELEAALTPVALQIYWTLYLGVLAFWTNDRSPKQVETLALLDQSLSMFANWLGSHEPD